MNVHAYATKLGIDLYQEYKASEAAPLVRVGINKINAAANDNELPYIQTGTRNRVYLGLDLIRWKLSKRTQLGNSTSPKTETDFGAELGMTNRPDSDALEVLAQKTFQTQSKS
jgi:hypothetical protein